MKYLFLAIFLSLASATPASAFTCDQVRWAVAHLPTSVIEGYRKFVSDTDYRKALACLATPGPAGKGKKHRHRG